MSRQIIAILMSVVLLISSAGMVFGSTSADQTSGQAEVSSVDAPEDQIASPTEVSTTDAPEDQIASPTEVSTADAPENQIASPAEVSTADAPENQIASPVEATSTDVPADQTTSPAEPTFADMPDDWSTNALQKAVANGLLSGYAQGDKQLLKPSSPLLRAEMATIINRAFATAKKGDISGVKDVPAHAWYAGEMAKAVKMGTFMLDANMRPEDRITREEAFAVLARAFKLTVESTGATKTLDRFSDKADIAGWAQGSLANMVEAGYIQGANGKLQPKANITRAEFAVVMDNLAKQYIDRAETVTEILTGNVVVRTSGVTLKNVTIEGDLIIADGVGEGDVTLDNVTVEGRTVIRGGGVNSIIIKGNSDVGKVIVAKVDGEVRVYVEGGAQVEVIYVDDGSDDVTVEGRIAELEVAGDNVTVTAKGARLGKAGISGDNSIIVVTGGSTVRSANISGRESSIIAENGATIDKITISGPDASVEGEGSVKEVDIVPGGDGAIVSTPGTVTNIANGVAGVVSGAESEGAEEGGAGIGGGTEASARRVRAVEIENARETMMLAVGDTDTVVAIIEPENATNQEISWFTSDVEVAFVDNQGVVTGLKSGYATITAVTVDSGFRATKHVVVGDVLVPAHFAGSEDPQQTIQAVIDAAAESSVIVVAAGEYREQLTINKPITLLGPNAGIAGYEDRNAEAVLLLSEFPSIHSYENTVTVDSDDVTISGFTLDDELRAAWNFGSWKDQTSGPYNMVGIYSAGDNVEIRDNIFSGFSMAQLVGSGGHYTVEDNYFKDSGWDVHYHTLLLSNVSAEVRNNRWSRAIGMRIQRSTGGGVIEGNAMDVIHRGIEISSDAVALNWTIRNNTITASPIPEGYSNFVTNWIGFEGDHDLDDLICTNTFEKGSKTAGQKILIPEQGEAYNQRSGAVYTTIQAAVDDAQSGDSILVGPGEYAELVKIGKSLTLKGANAGIDPNTGRREPESIITGENTTEPDGYHKGAGIQLLNSAADVIIDGFEFTKTVGSRAWFGGSDQGAIFLAPTDNGYASGSKTNCFKNITIVNNYFHDLTAHAVLKDVYARHEGLSIRDNRMVRIGGEGTSFTAIKIQGFGGAAHGGKYAGVGGEIVGNVIDQASYAGIIIDNVEGFVIDGNVIKGVPSAGINVDAMGLGNKDLTISNNTFEDAAASGGKAAVRIKDGIYKGLIEISGNTFATSKVGLLFEGGIAPESDTTFVVEENRFIGNGTGLENKSDTDSIKAQLNYWGHESGPFNSELNPAGQGDSISGRVSFLPWYTDERMTALSATPPR